MTAPESDDLTEDRLLVSRYLAGDQQAFDSLYLKHASGVLAFVATRTPAGLSKEDVADEAWAKVVVNLPRFDNNHFRGWLFQIVHRCLTDAHRFRTRRKEQPLTDGTAVAVASESSADADEDRKLALHSCLESLGSVFVNTIIRNKLHGEKPEDIALQDGVTKNAVYSRINRGNQELRQCIESKLGESS